MKRLSLILTLVITLLGTFQAPAQDTSKQQKKKETLEKEIDNLNRKMQATDKKRKTAQNNLNITRKKVKAGKAQVEKSRKEVNNLDSQIREKQSNINSLEKQLKKMETHYGKLVRGAYKVRRPQTWYTLIMASNSFEQAGRRYAYMKKISLRLRQQVTQVNRTKEELAKERADLDVLLAQASEVKRQREKDLKALQKTQRKGETEVANLNKDKKSLQKQIAAKQKQVDALNREIKKLIAAAVSKSKSGSNAGSSSSKSSSGKAVTTNYDVKLSNDFVANKGRLPWPVNGNVVDHYGQHYHPVYTSVKLPFNYGVTVATKPGSSVKAVFNGVVQSIAVMPGYNQCVLIQHGNYYTFYCKLKSVSVKSGDKVTTGQTIGTVDTIAGETQVHFQLWKDSNPQNPESWLR